MKSIVQEDETSHGGLSIGKLPQRAILSSISKATCQSILHQQHGGNLIQAKDLCLRDSFHGRKEKRPSHDQSGSPWCLNNSYRPAGGKHHIQMKVKRKKKPAQYLHKTSLHVTPASKLLAQVLMSYLHMKNMRCFALTPYQKINKSKKSVWIWGVGRFFTREC